MFLLVENQKFVISLMTILYIHVEKIFLKLKNVQSSDDVTLSGIITDKNLTFKRHIDN